MIREKRTYNLQKRARAAEETRLRIIEAARALFSDSGYPNVSLDAIAAHAGVSRQTVYVQFGSKSGVLEALIAHIEQLSFGTDADFEDRVDAVIESPRDDADPLEDLLVIFRHGLKLLMHFNGENSPLLRNFRAQAAYDPDFRAVWVRGMNNHHRAMHRLVLTIDALGKLAPGWTVDSASDWLAAIAHFNQYDMLVVERGWTPEQVSERLVQLVRDMLIYESEKKAGG